LSGVAVALGEAGNLIVAADDSGRVAADLPALWGATLTSCEKLPSGSLIASSSPFHYRGRYP
jgi:hypothetical protein